MPNTPRLTCCCRQTPPDSLDVVILVCKLLVVEAELIHEVGCHLLDLVLGEGLGRDPNKSIIEVSRDIPETVSGAAWKQLLQEGIKIAGSAGNPRFRPLPTAGPHRALGFLLPGRSQPRELLWESPEELNTRAGSRVQGAAPHQDGPKAVGAASFPGIVKMFPTHLLQSELVGKSTFNVLILTGGVQVVGAHLGKHKPVRDQGKLGKLQSFSSTKAQTPAEAGAAPRNPGDQPSTTDQLC